MRNLLVSGYRSFELGVFKDDDPKVAVIKKSLKEEIRLFLDEGVEWILSGGQFGVEQWSVETVNELKADYPYIRVALIFPFSEFGSSWNEQNQQRLNYLKTLADFIDSTSHQTYKDPSQLKNHQAFMLSHSDASLLVYDPEFEGKTKYLYQEIKNKQMKESYECRMIDFDHLQNSILED